MTPTPAGEKPAPKKYGSREQLLPLVEAVPVGDTSDRLPKKLSPSRASDYNKCPRAFFYKTIVGIKEPTSVAALRGSLAHVAFENIFDLPAGERTVEQAVAFIKPAWEEMLNPNIEGLEDYKAQRKIDDAAAAAAAAPPGSDIETQLLADAEACVRSWFDMERVNNFTPHGLELPNGRKLDGRELYVVSRLAKAGITVHGFVDRLDRFETSDGRVVWAISDYKTSATVPWLKNPNWAERTREKIREESFFQLRVYALLAYLMFGIRVSLLRLVYVATGDRENGIQEDRVTQQIIDKTQRQLETTWRAIRSSARTGDWPTKTGPLCDWCFMRDICPSWAPEVSDIVAEVHDIAS